MEDERKLLDENELSSVNGGNYLSEAEIKGLSVGQVLVIENAFGINVGTAEYLGETRSPGEDEMLQCKVKVLTVTHYSGYLRSDDYDKIKPGDVVYLSRYYLDFTWRA